MKSQSTVRTFDVFNEVTPGFAFSKSRAETIYQSATELVGRYTGPIALSPVRGVRLPLGDRPISLFNFRLNSGAYSLLLTSRRLVDPYGKTASVSGGGTVTTRKQPDGSPQPDSVASTTRSIISSYGNLTDSALTVLTAHEVSHTFMGPRHCPNTSCIMQNPDSVSSLHNTALLAQLAQQALFCGNCIETLKDRGQQAAAAVMLEGLNFDE